MQEQDARTSHFFQRGVTAVAYQDLGVQKFKSWKMSEEHQVMYKVSRVDRIQITHPRHGDNRVLCAVYISTRELIESSIPVSVRGLRERLLGLTVAPSIGTLLLSISSKQVWPDC